jgi:hypothetical protein
MATAMAVGSAHAEAAAPRVTTASPRVLATPHVHVSGDPAAHLVPGYFFAGPKYDAGAPPAGARIGPEILDAQGRAVYFDQTPNAGGVRATDVRAQIYHGKRVLTYWQGGTPKGPDGVQMAGVGSGSDYILDQNYRVIKTVHGRGYEKGLPITADQHEFLLTPNNTALITCYAVTRRDATAEGGDKNQAVLDGIVEEIDLATSKVVFKWNSLDHVGMKYSKQPMSASADSPWDYFHINAVKLDTDKNLIVSSRHTSTIYKVDHRSGRIIWSLSSYNPKGSSIRALPGVNFSWQHDPEPLGNNTYRIFDNAATTGQNPPPPTSNYSNVQTVKVDPIAKTATLVGQPIVHSPGVLANSQGNSQALPSGHVMIGWGSTNRMSEYNAKHQQIWSGKFDQGFNTYRAYKSPWVGTPGGHPSLTFTGSGSSRQVDVLWNGATRVHKWRILGGSTRSNVATIASTPWNGLDTAFKLSSYPKYLRIAAVDAHGHVLAYTNTKSTR